MTTQQTIHDAVQKHYGAIAQAKMELPVVTSCCCGESSSATVECGCNDSLYNATLLEGLPVDVTGLSLGCGDPVTLASLQPGETVLDLGSGGGIDCFLAARQVGDAGHVIGVDMTPAMLEKANASKARLGAQNVEFREGKIEALPVEDSTIDVVISNCVINLSPEKPKVFSEIFRVLNPGGRVSISDIVIDGDFSPELRGDLAQWADCVTGAVEVTQYVGMLRDAGFVDIQVVDKVNAEPILGRQDGMPRIYSARITARKPHQVL